MEWLALAGALLLVLANGFFVAFEYSMVKVRATQLETLVAEHRAGAKTALAVRKSLDTWLSASQTGITLASLALGWIGEPAVARLIQPHIAALAGSVDYAQKIADPLGLALSFG